MYKVLNNNIYITRGDSGIFPLTLKDKDGNTYTPAADDMITFTVKSSTDVSAHLVQKQITDGVLYINPVDTESLDYGNYTYDVQIQMANGYTDTVIGPKLFIVREEVNF